MKNYKQLLTLTIIFLVFYAAVFAVLIWFVFPGLDETQTASIVGILIGALAGALGGIVTTVLGIWERTREVDERTRDRVSDAALQLTKMDYELRQKSLELQNRQDLFLAPTKVYRELYKALLELNTKGTWPKSVEENRLLNIFPLGGQSPPTTSEKESGADWFPPTSFYPADQLEDE